MRVKDAIWIVWYICWYESVHCLTRVAGYQPRNFFASTVKGLENVLARELLDIPDVSNIKTEKAGVSFTGSVVSGLSCLLWLRTSLKLMEKIEDGQSINSKTAIKKFIGDIDWCQFLSIDQSLKCDCILGQNVVRELQHSHYTSLTIKNAIVDQFRTKFGRRPNVDIANPDLSLLAYLHKQKISLYRVWSGETSLHRRSYRLSPQSGSSDMERNAIIHKAALRESTAAALLLLSNWQATESSAVLVDPMCGSGTFLIEGALIACDTAPGLIRYGSNMEEKTYCTIPPLRWIDIAAAAQSNWQELIAQAVLRDKRHDQNAAFLPMCAGNDWNLQAIALARSAARNAEIDHLISWSEKDIDRFSLSSPSRSVIVITNPPWDKRLSGADSSWDKLANFLQRQKKGGTAYVLTGNQQLTKHLSPLIPDATIHFSAANMEQQFLRFRL